jgi:peptidoglycan hydrolase CwlO-like protein
MRRALATLGALVLVGGFAVSVSAQRGGPVITVVAGVNQDKRPCTQLPELRHELARLQQELRRLDAALEDAKAAGNRDRAKQIMQEIRQVKAQIEHVQQEIRRLLQHCGD